MTTATDDERDHPGLPCEPGLICPSHVEIDELQKRLAAAESRAARYEAALREIDAEFAHKHRNDRQWALWMKDRARAALAEIGGGRG